MLAKNKSYLRKIGSILNRLSEMKILTTINYFAALVSAGMIFGLMAYNAYATCARYFFNAPPRGSTEISTYLIPVLVFLALAYNLEVDRHVVVDMVIGRLRMRSQLILKGLTTILIAIFGAALTWKGVELSLDKLHEVSSSDLEFPLFPFYIFVPIGGLLLLLQSIRNIRIYVLSLTKMNSNSKGID